MKKKHFKYFINILLFTCVFSLFITELINAQSVNENEYNCFTILVGKNATTDGSVLLAHNEDDHGEHLVNWYKVPFLSHKSRETITLMNGAKIQQLKETNGYIWLEMQGMKFSDSYMNQWGVTISSDQCRSKEKEVELKDGGIGYWLRRIMAERAKSAKEAVKIGGRIVEEIGYASSGRSYCIADPDEVWILAVVKGKHWVAQRVPDNKVACIPNYYTITKIDLSDTNNFLGASDIIDYAIQKKWYNPDIDGTFNFRKAYADTSSLKSMSNIARHWRAVNLLSNKKYNINDELPFAFYPENKISISDLMIVLRDHYEETEFYQADTCKNNNPHKNKVMPICSETNQYGFIAQLRSVLPIDIGAVLWLAPRRPCTQPFIPWYYGIIDIPDIYTMNNHQSALEQHFQAADNIYDIKPDHAFLTFINIADSVDKDYKNNIKEIIEKRDAFEEKLIKNQSGFENQIYYIYQNDPVKAKEMLNEYTSQQAEKAVELYDK